MSFNIPWTPVTEVKEGWFVYRFDDWLKVLKVESDGKTVTFTILDTNPDTEDNKPVEKVWEYELSAKIIAVETLPGQE